MYFRKPVSPGKDRKKKKEKRTEGKNEKRKQCVLSMHITSGVTPTAF